MSRFYGRLIGLNDMQGRPAWSGMSGKKKPSDCVLAAGPTESRSMEFDPNR